jgi:hypothetical protein
VLPRWGMSSAMLYEDCQFGLWRMVWIEGESVKLLHYNQISKYVLWMGSQGERRTGS